MRSLLRSAALLLLATVPAVAGEIGPFTGPEADAEAARLYERADNFVNNVTEGPYSYSYIQFHWKRAGSNIDRILRAYPSSPTAQRLRNGELMVGPFERNYFKERVLPRLEEKKVGAFDAVNNAIFLYELAGNQDDVGRRELLKEIITTLCRQKRWGEALNFPVRKEGRHWLWTIVARQAGYSNDKVVEELFQNSTVDERPSLLAAVAESRAFRGDTPDELESFLDEHAEIPSLRAHIFIGLARRERVLHRSALFGLPLDSAYDGVDPVKNPEQRVDVDILYSNLPTGAIRGAANHEYVRYLAAIGEIDKAKLLATADDLLDCATSYAGYLVAKEEYTQALEFTATFALGAKAKIQLQLNFIELLAQAGRDRELASARTRVPLESTELAAFHEWRGRIFSTINQLVVREHTFAQLPIKDPNLVGRLVCEWSLTPNRTLRGAAPWDAIVYKFAPGFEKLPEPKDKNKVEAAGR